MVVVHGLALSRSSVFVETINQTPIFGPDQPDQERKKETAQDQSTHQHKRQDQKYPDDLCLHVVA